MKPPEPNFPELWIEVSNIAYYAGENVIGVQIKGDVDTERSFRFKADPIDGLIEAIKEKRPIHAKIAVTNRALGVTDLRVSLAAARTSS